jgi:hypothetical protein
MMDSALIMYSKDVASLVAISVPSHCRKLDNLVPEGSNAADHLHAFSFVFFDRSQARRGFALTRSSTTIG